MSFTTCPHCGNNSLIPVYSHRLCDDCGWHSPNFEDLQFKDWKLGDPIAVNVLDFLNPWSPEARRAMEEVRTNKVVRAWCSRWMPEKVSKNRTDHQESKQAVAAKPPVEPAQPEDERIPWRGTERQLAAHILDLYKKGEIGEPGKSDRQVIIQNADGYVIEKNGRQKSVNPESLWRNYNEQFQ